jgi:hypothetical protein
MAETWTASGSFVDFCKCNVPCPCSWGRPPTEGDCQGIVAWQIDEGTYGDVKLDGLSVAGVSEFEGNIWDDGVKMDAGLFIDESADDAQREALQTIFGGQAGGWPAALAETAFGEVKGIEFAAIDLEIADDSSSWSIEINGKVSGSAEVLTGPTSRPGEKVQVTGLPGSEVGPSNGPTTYGLATKDEVDAYGYKWDWAGRSAKHTPFEWSSEDEF